MASRKKRDYEALFARTALVGIGGLILWELLEKTGTIQTIALEGDYSTWSAFNDFDVGNTADNRMVNGVYIDNSGTLNFLAQGGNFYVYTASGTGNQIGPLSRYTFSYIYFGAPNNYSVFNKYMINNKNGTNDFEVLKNYSVTQTITNTTDLPLLSNLTAMAISPNGQWIAISGLLANLTQMHVYIFKGN